MLGPILDLVQALRRVDARDRYSVLLLRLRRAFRHAPPSLPPVRADGGRVLFVCHGNIMRSPMAEALLRKATAGRGRVSLDICSAGTHARPGSPGDPRAVAAAERYGVSLDAHRATLLSEQLMRSADLVFVMDRHNEAAVLARFPSHERKVMLLGAFAPSDADGASIPDPYGGSAGELQRCYERLERSVEAVVTLLT